MISGKKKSIAFAQTRAYLVVLIIIFALAAVLVPIYNYIYNPASSIHYTLYIPHDKSLFSGHLVIPSYKDGKFIVYGQQQGIAGYAIYGDGTKVIEEKSSEVISCKTVANCVMRTTPKGQSYAYITLQTTGSANYAHRKVVFKKGNTKITLERDHYLLMNDHDWDVLVDSFEPTTTQHMSGLFTIIRSEHFWSPV